MYICLPNAVWLSLHTVLLFILCAAGCRSGWLLLLPCPRFEMAEFQPFEGERQELQQRGVTEAAAWLQSSRPT